MNSEMNVVTTLDEEDAVDDKSSDEDHFYSSITILGKLMPLDKRMLLYDMLSNLSHESYHIRIWIKRDWKLKEIIMNFLFKIGVLRPIEDRERRMWYWQKSWIFYPKM